MIHSKATCTCFVLVGNGEATIRRCLESAINSGCFESILVILDSDSRDTTPVILSEYVRSGKIKAFVYRWKRPADFSEVRNAAIANIDTQYAFWLDADEVLIDPDGLRGLLEKPGPAYLVWVDSPLPVGSHNMYQPRLFPITPGVKFECPVFERLDWSLKEHGVPIVSTNLRPINHDGYMDQRTLKLKNQRNRAILARWWQWKNRSWIHAPKIETEPDRHTMEQLRRLS